VDWADCSYLAIDGKQKTVYCFSIILGYSRMRFMEFTLATDVSTLIACHLHAFDYFGGYTEEILYDNIKTVILKQAIRSGDHQWNAKFEDFFTHFGFIPRVCKPYCPQTKEKIENSIGFMKRDFLLDRRMDVRIGTEVICTHLVVPGHGRVIREKEHFAGLLAEAM